MMKSITYQTHILLWYGQERRMAGVNEEYLIGVHLEEEEKNNPKDHLGMKIGWTRRIRIV